MIITQTPLRISLLGGNTDFRSYFKRYGGAVLTTTIDKYIYCIVKKRFDNEIWINYSIKEKVLSIKDIKHDLVREAMRLIFKTDGMLSHGIEITFLSDILSKGSGLGSSSAVVVGVLNALHHYKNETVTARQLAEEACYIEIDVLKKPIGCQDQYAIAFGGLNKINFGKKITFTPMKDSNRHSLMLFYTGITRKADKVLLKMKFNKKILDRNKEMVHATGKHSFAALLNEYWTLKKRLNPAVTNSYINKLYKKALAEGALGGKIIGAGGGGFLLLVVPLEKQQNMRSELGLRELPFKYTPYGSRVIFNINE